MRSSREGDTNWTIMPFSYSPSLLAKDASVILNTVHGQAEMLKSGRPENRCK